MPVVELKSVSIDSVAGTPPAARSPTVLPVLVITANSPAPLPYTHLGP